MTESKEFLRLKGEPYGDYYARLLDTSHKAEEAKQTHETWKRRHWDGITRDDCEHRILVVLRELLKSDFFRPNYFDTGIPVADIRNAASDLAAMGFNELGDDIDGADWKYALFCRVLRKRGEKRILIDTEAAGLYIDEMYGELTTDAIEAFFRFAMFTRLAYEEIDRMATQQPSARRIHTEPEQTPEQRAVAAFVAKINELGKAAYDRWNGKRVVPAAHKAEVEIIIDKDRLVQQMQSRMKHHFDELSALCYPETSNTKRDFCLYVARLQGNGFFGQLPNKYLAELLAPIVGLSKGTATNYLSKP